jgi:hypothetical protein
MRRFSAMVSMLLGILAVTSSSCSDAARSPAAPTGRTALGSAAAEPVAAGDPLAQLSGKPSAPRVTALSVTVSDVDAFGNPAGITGDGSGPYIDGNENVEARLDSAGTFAFNTFVAKRGSATRWVHYDFSRPVDPSNTLRPAQDHAQNYHFSSGGSAYSPWVPVQFLGTPGYPTSECGYMGNSFAATSTTSYRVSFHKGFEDTAASPTAFAVFTRVSVSPAVWTVQSAGACSPASNVAALRSADGAILYGYYSIPFMMTLTAR